MRICVFFFSSNLVADEYKQMANQFGKELAMRNHVLVYGGATGGLMDSVAEGAVEMQGEVVGVIPEVIIRANRLSSLPTHLIKTADMSERKKSLRDEADVFVVLPGGYGTLDEMFDVIASGTVGEHKKPLICLNLNGFYDHLILHTERLKKRSFTPKQESYKPYFVQSLDECLELISEFQVKMNS